MWYITSILFFFFLLALILTVHNYGLHYDPFIYTYHLFCSYSFLVALPGPPAIVLPTSTLLTRMSFLGVSLLKVPYRRINEE